MPETKLENFKKAIREMYEGGAVLGLGLIELNNIVYPKLQNELNMHLKSGPLNTDNLSAINCVLLTGVNYLCELQQQDLDSEQAARWTLGEFNTTSRECLDFFNTCGKYKTLKLETSNSAVKPVAFRIGT